MIAAALYLANQTRAGFPLDAVVESVGFADAWVLFGATHEDRMALAALDVGLVLDGPAIARPADISGAMNYARRKTFEATDADFVVLVQADTASTPAVDAAVRAVAAEERLDEGFHFYAIDAHLYLRFQSGWGFSMVGRAHERTFYDDGLGLHLRYDLPPCLHLGYLSTDLAMRHVTVNLDVWGAPADHRPSGLGGSVEDFIITHAAHVRDRAGALERMDPAFEPFVARLGLEADRERVYRTLTEARLWT